MVDVAREANVSLKTVSRVVNGAPDVGPGYVLRVREAIDKLGFVRNNMARDLRSNGETAMIGLVIGDLGNPFYSLLARSIERVARRYGSLLLISSSEEDPQRERELIVELCERRVDGLIIVPTYADHSFCADEMRRGMPMVFLDRHPAGIEADTVLIDNDEGAFMGTQLLLDRGHRRIAVIGQDIRVEAMAQRLAGATRAASAAGAGLDDALVRFGPLTPEQAGQAADELLDLPDPPTAFFCCTNRIARGVVDQVWRRGLELDVVGFDNLEPSHPGPGPIAMVAYELEELGRLSAELLFRRIDGERGAPEDVIVPVTLVEMTVPAGLPAPSALPIAPLDAVSLTRMERLMPLPPIRLGPNQPPRFYRGGHGIARLRGTAVTSDYASEDLVGSTTELSGGGGLTVLADGRTLRDAIAADPVAYLGSRHVERFGHDLGLLVKLLDTGERLLVHFHPGREFAAKHLHSCHGKTEAWVITDVTDDPADPSAGQVYLGFREEVSLDTVRGWVGAQDRAALLGSLNQIAVQPGDTCLVPAGVPHAIGTGITLVEVQEPTDFSILLEWQGYRIDGPAEGHLGLGFNTALEALDRSAWDKARLEGVLGRGQDRSPADVTRLLPAEAEEFFRVEQVDLRGSRAAVASFPAQFAVLIVLDGQGQLRAGQEVLPLPRGTTALVPYDAGPTTIHGDVTLLRCMPPDPDV